MSNKPLSIEEKRQVVYSSALAFTSEASSLRHRVIDRLVLGALIGSTKGAPFRVNVIRQNLITGKSHPLALRSVVIEDSLERLVAAKKVDESGDSVRHHTFYLPDSTANELSQQENEIDTLFQASADRAFANTTVLFNREIADRVFRRFALFAFASSSRVIAQSIAGPARAGDVVAPGDSRVAFEEAITGESLSTSQRESLEARCLNFLSSVDPADEKLRFQLVQGYYFAQLLGVEEGGFNPLARETFADATLYLDTNVLTMGLLPVHLDENAFAEVLNVAKRAGIHLTVTRATLNELRDHIAKRGKDLNKILSSGMPGQLASRTNDQLSLAFFAAQSKNPGLTVTAFLAGLAPFEQTILNWGIVIDERVTEDLIDGRDVSDVSKVFQEEIVKIRGWEKPGPILLHDVANYCLVEDERKAGRDAWFLTRDGSLPRAAAILRPNELPFCLNQVAFLQSISPFIETREEEYSFADVFASLMGQQFNPTGPIFDSSELLLLAEYNQDVLATPVDQLIEAIDYVKVGLLQGRPYTKADIPNVSLELRKFLTSDRETRLKVLDAERIRQEQIANDERRQRAATEQQRDDAIQREIAVKSDLETAESDFAQRLGVEKSKRTNLEDELKTERAKVARAKRNGRILLAVLGLAIGWLFAHFRIELVMWIEERAPSLREKASLISIAVKTVGALIFTLPTIRFVRHEKLGDAKSAAAITILSVAAIWTFSFIDKGVMADASNLFGVGAFIALVVLFFFFG